MFRQPRFILFAIALCALASFCTRPQVKLQGGQPIKARLEMQYDSLDRAFKQLEVLVKAGNKSAIKQGFLTCRKSFKQIEWFCEYYSPLSSKELNGAPVPEIEAEENKVIQPKGLQVMEEYIFPTYNKQSENELLAEIKSARSILTKAHTILSNTELSDAHIFEAGKQEIFRIISLGISGFDTPLSASGLDEAAVALQSLREVFLVYGEDDQLNHLFAQAIAYLSDHRNFNEFDRLSFIARYTTPITKRLIEWQKELKIKSNQEQFALYSDAFSFFDSAAFNPNYFTGSRESWLSPEKIQLGKKLFSDPLISGANRTCQDCHNPTLAFTDGEIKSKAVTPETFVKRNAPTLLYAGLQQAQFYDMRSPSLENQAMEVIGNKDEMHGSIDTAAVRLSKSSEYRRLFKNAFPSMEDELKPRFVMIAIASYIRSLNPFSSRLDRYMSGQYDQINTLEQKGFNLFMGKAKCGSCHFMPLFNGTVPPTFTNTEAEVLGVPEKANGLRLDPDRGRFSVHQIPELKFAFKTPTLRNIAITAPYMHNGAFKTLDEVLDFYNNGGGAGAGIKLENQTLSPDSLHLNESEKKAVIAFLNTLTDEKWDKNRKRTSGR